jgi:hypothetical protein
MTSIVQTGRKIAAIGNNYSSANVMDYSSQTILIRIVCYALQSVSKWSRNAWKCTESGHFFDYTGFTVQTSCYIEPPWLDQHFFG